MPCKPLCGKVGRSLTFGDDTVSTRRYSCTETGHEFAAISHNAAITFADEALDAMVEDLAATLPAGSPAVARA